ncbi:MAG: hypothetical protein ACRD0J_16685 [Acidimicrobiales bacterium]
MTSEAVASGPRTLVLHPDDDDDVVIALPELRHEELVPWPLGAVT